MKRFLAILIALSLALTCLPVWAGASDAPLATILCGSDFQNNCYDPGYNRFLYDSTPLADQPRSQSLQSLLSSVAGAGVLPDSVLFAGDYTDHFQEDGDGRTAPATASAISVRCWTMRLEAAIAASTKPCSPRATMTAPGRRASPPAAYSPMTKTAPIWSM